MPEDTPSPLPETPSSGIPTAPASDVPQKPLSFNIGEEYGTAKKSLPPVKLVLIALVVIGIIAAALIFTQEQAPATGSITDVSAVEVPGQNMVMVAVDVSMHNRSRKPFQVVSIHAELDTGNSVLADDAAPAVDLDRYFQAFPVLNQHSLPPLARENTIAANTDAQGVFVVTFPVTPQVFASRKSLKVTVQSYDRGVPLVLMK